MTGAGSSQPHSMGESSFSPDDFVRLSSLRSPALLTLYPRFRSHSCASWTPSRIATCSSTHFPFHWTNLSRFTPHSIAPGWPLSHPFLCPSPPRDTRLPGPPRAAPSPRAGRRNRSLDRSTSRQPLPLRVTTVLSWPLSLLPVSGASRRAPPILGTSAPSPRAALPGASA